MDNWYFEQMSENIQYIRMATFSNSSKNKKAFQAFFEKTKDNLAAENIIIDLRSNGGGNKKYSDPFIKYLKKSKAQIYVITNIGTGSNSEQFTVKLKNQVNATQVGERTNGTIAYGRNYGNSYTTPSGIYSILPTDMNFHNRYFEYEYVGVQPEIQLDNNSDWLEQLKAIIGSKNL
jgi:C-terminal processing protease CtpA/Prc